MSRRRGPLLATGLSATGAAVVAVLIIYAAAWLMDDPLLVEPESGGAAEKLAVEIATLATIAGGAIGLGLAAVARRVAARPAPAFVITCLVGLTAYGLLAVLRSPHTSTAVWLNLMHLAAAIPIVGLLTLRLAHRAGEGSDVADQASS